MNTKTVKTNNQTTNMNTQVVDTPKQASVMNNQEQVVDKNNIASPKNDTTNVNKSLECQEDNKNLVLSIELPDNEKYESDRKLVKPERVRLSDKRLKYFTDRAISVDWAEVAGRDVTSQEAQSLLVVKTMPKSGGIWLEDAFGSVTFRPDKPYKTANDIKEHPKKKAPKYRHRVGEGHEIFFPKHPEDRDYWDKRNREELKTRCIKINGVPCVIHTEAPTKAVAGCANGLPTVGFAGCQNALTPGKWEGDKERFVKPEIKELCKDGFGAIVAMDSDWQGKKDVELALVKYVAKLKLVAPAVYIVSWEYNPDDEGTKGMDDYIKKEGIEAFRQRLLKVEEAEEFLKRYRENKALREGGTAASIARAIFEDKNDILRWNAASKEWFVYELEFPGVWSQASLEDLMEYIIKETENQRGGTNYDHRVCYSAEKLLRSHLKVGQMKPLPGYICLRDGALNLETMALEPHMPEFKFLHSRPYKWADADKGCQPIIDFLDFANKGHQDRIQLIRAAMKATVLAKGAEIQRLIEMTGGGGTGKSTILHLVEMLVGVDSYAVTKLKRLESNRFETSKFFNKLAVAITDSEQYSGDVSTLKALCGGDKIPNERKNKDPNLDHCFEGIVWVANNKAIASKEYSSGFRRIQIPLTNVVALENQRDLRNDFKPYLAGFLKWVLEMPDTEMRGYLKNTNKYCPSLTQFSFKVLTETNQVARWLQENIIYTPGINTNVGTVKEDPAHYLYPNYLEFCRETGKEGMGQQTFTGYVKNVLVEQIGLKDCINFRNRYGSQFKNLSIRKPGDTLSPLLFGDYEEDNVKSASNERCDGQNDENVTAEMPTSSEVDGNDGFSSQEVEKNNCHSPQPQNQSEAVSVKNPSHPPETPGGQGFNPSHTPHVPVHKPVTTDNYRVGDVVYPQPSKTPGEKTQWEGKECIVSDIRGEGITQEIYIYPTRKDCTARGVASASFRKHQLGRTKFAETNREPRATQQSLNLSSTVSLSRYNFNQPAEGEYLEMMDD